MKQLKIALAIGGLVIPFLLSTEAFANKENTTKRPDKVALAESDVTQLMLLMDTDKSGRISKQDWMKFMEIEFDRLDKGKTGTVNVRQLPQPQQQPVRFSNAGK